MALVNDMNDDLRAQFNHDAFTAHRDGSGMIVEGGYGGEIDIKSRMPNNPQEPIAEGFAFYAVIDKSIDDDHIELTRYHMVTAAFCRWCGKRNPDPLNGVVGCITCDKYGDWPSVRRTIR